MNVRVLEYLKKNGFDGLFNDNGECACDLADLCPCDSEGIEECQPGHKKPCDCGEEHEFHIELKEAKP